uniref:Elongation factor Ts, mitochondrial n=1 Tax=Anopheles coluzzii TaxID=1518534 RepID=A0A8W7P742_ANOCL
MSLCATAPLLQLSNRRAKEPHEKNKHKNEHFVNIRHTFCDFSKLSARLRPPWARCVFVLPARGTECKPGATGIGPSHPSRFIETMGEPIVLILSADATVQPESIVERIRKHTNGQDRITLGDAPESIGFPYQIHTKYYDTQVVLCAHGSADLSTVPSAILNRTEGMLIYFDAKDRTFLDRLPAYGAFHLSRLLPATGIRLYATAEKSALATLRKKTGYTFANCKKALELHNNDLAKAEQWLKEQATAMGWSKATKLEGRNTAQGLIGVLVQRNVGAMVEVNCETDFVARNASFQRFVQVASAACVRHLEKVESDANLTKVGLNSEALKQIVLDDGKSLGDHLALMIGTVGENASLNRAICYKVPDSIQLTGYVHPAPSEEIPHDVPLLGKYGSLVAFKSEHSTVQEGADGAELSPAQVARKVCQHIVGMKPERIGVPGKDEPSADKDDETCLIHQEYLVDPAYTVGEVLEANRLQIVDFQRFACGEKSQSEEQNVRAATN